MNNLEIKKAIINTKLNCRDRINCYGCHHKGNERCNITRWPERWMINNSYPELLKIKEHCIKLKDCRICFLRDKNGGKSTFCRIQFEPKNWDLKQYFIKN